MPEGIIPHISHPPETNSTQAGPNVVELFGPGHSLDRAAVQPLDFGQAIRGAQNATDIAKVYEQIDTLASLGTITRSEASIYTEQANVRAGEIQGRAATETPPTPIQASTITREQDAFQLHLQSDRIYDALNVIKRVDVLKETEQITPAQADQLKAEFQQQLYGHVSKREKAAVEDYIGKGKFSYAKQSIDFLQSLVNTGYLDESTASILRTDLLIKLQSAVQVDQRQKFTQTLEGSIADARNMTEQGEKLRDLGLTQEQTNTLRAEFQQQLYSKVSGQRQELVREYMTRNNFNDAKQEINYLQTLVQSGYLNEPTAEKLRIALSTELSKKVKEDCYLKVYNYVASHDYANAHKIVSDIPSLVAAGMLSVEDKDDLLKQIEIILTF